MGLILEPSKHPTPDFDGERPTALQFILGLYPIRGAKETQTQNVFGSFFYSSLKLGITRFEYPSNNGIVPAPGA